MSNLFSLSEAGTKFITQRSFDSFVALPYKDSGGLWTIGFGTRITDKQVIEFKNGITEAQARDMYKAHLQGLTKQLQRCPLAGFSQNQYDAIFSLSYNIGMAAFQTSTIYRVLTTRGIDLNPWLWFVRDEHGKVQPGLVRRRQMELKLFIYGLYT